MPDRAPQDAEEQGQALLLALFRVVRCMRVPAPGEVIDLAAMYLLQFVAENPGTRISELADHVGLDPSTVSRLVRNLEQLGYLARQPDPKDKRAALMFISESGAMTMIKALQWRTTLISQALQGWSAKERGQLVTLGMKFAADFEKVVVP